MIEMNTPVLDDLTDEMENLSLEHGTLELTAKNCAKERESSDYIKSWANATRGDAPLFKSTDGDNAVPQLKFEVVSARTVDSVHQRKYVAYTVMVRWIGANDDPHPAVIERRYNDFLALYNSLRRSHSEALNAFQFPRKAFIGNFKPEMISARSLGFEEFLTYITERKELKDSKAVSKFFQQREIVEGLKLIQDGQYDQARPLVENSFHLMNKMQTDRSPMVLRYLCLLVGVCDKCCQAEDALNHAALAVRRYQSVSDVDLLRYYVPLLHTTVELCKRTGRDPIAILDHINHLKFKGINTSPITSLLHLVMTDLAPVLDYV